MKSVNLTSTLSLLEFAHSVPKLKQNPNAYPVLECRTTTLLARLPVSNGSILRGSWISASAATVWDYFRLIIEASREIDCLRHTSLAKLISPIQNSNDTHDGLTMLAYYARFIDRGRRKRRRGGRAL